MASVPAGPLGVRARDIAARYPGSARDALRDVSFELQPGELLLVVGASGSGKSTLARAIAGVLETSGGGGWSGGLEVGGEPVRAGGSGRTGVVFQDPASQLVMERVEDDVAFGLENVGWSLAAMRSRVPEALAEAGLAGFEGRRSGRLSGGEQQRVALAGVLAPRPGLLVLDEPTANLDPAGSGALFERLAEIRGRRSATVVLVEHRVDAAWPLADQVLALASDGAPIDVGPPTDVVARSGLRMRAEGIWLPEPIEAALGGPGPHRPAPPASPAVGPILATVRDLAFGFDRREPVLIDVDLDLRAGERVALTGPNGSGKSTLGRLLAGLLRPNRGTVAVRGEAPAGLAPEALARRVGHVPQDPELAFLADTVADEVALGLDRGAAAGVVELMDRLGLPLGQFGDRSPYRLSGGEQRRLSLAPALARRPDLLVLDEPTFGLDRRAHERLVAILDELVESGACVVLATHDERLVRAAATRRLVLAGGRVVADESLVA